MKIRKKERVLLEADEKRLEKLLMASKAGLEGQ